jgi:hypothetical protein
MPPVLREKKRESPHVDLEDLPSVAWPSRFIPPFKLLQEIPQKTIGLPVSRPQSTLHKLIKRNDRIAHRRPFVDVVDRSSAAPLRPAVTIMFTIIVVRVLRSSAQSTFVRSMARVAGSWVAVVDWEGWARVAAVADSDWLRMLMWWWRSVYRSGLGHWEGRWYCGVDVLLGIGRLDGLGVWCGVWCLVMS